MFLPYQAPVSSPPVADAGSNQTRSDLSSVSLDGSGSSLATSYSWSLLEIAADGTASNQTGLLSSTTTKSPTFNPRASGATYVATLTVTNADGSDTSSVVIAILADDTQVWNTLELSDATKDDTPGSEDSGTTDLESNVIGVNTNPSDGAAGRSALLYRWPVEIPPNARELVLQLPTVTISPRTNPYSIRFGFLDSTAQATSKGFVFDVGTSATADRIGIAPAWAAPSVIAPVVVPVLYRASVHHYVDSALSVSALTIASMFDRDASGYTERVRSNVGTETLTGLSGSTGYIAAIVHSPSGVASTFTLSGSLRYRWVTDSE